ncbi:hypothetical protein EDEG_03134 [Edhazardia aedis USNM 41457]|uniref:Transmembrane protein n=1 Tax=Edhazardia aedis (strain USNM 41457) TaxID=1003232 RepID=J9D3Q3_EDHAE|nr:hypothetical protein EDEG_03134 [Edhazardia aedis USNM 41457]|eukprot:EJW02461.1 hypothetical protein EDEG_03134 [Edhazardia aedis USNM 41457]
MVNIVLFIIFTNFYSKLNIYFIRILNKGLVWYIIPQLRILLLYFKLFQTTKTLKIIKKNIHDSIFLLEIHKYFQTNNYIYTTENFLKLFIAFIDQLINIQMDYLTK